MTLDEANELEAIAKRAKDMHRHLDNCHHVRNIFAETKGAALVECRQSGRGMTLPYSDELLRLMDSEIASVRADIETIKVM